MKSIINVQAKSYPILMLPNDSEIKIVVLFSEPKVGIVVATGNPLFSLGHRQEDWDMSVFKDFTGTVILSNI